MTSFMIFGDVAINLAMVASMRQLPHSVVLTLPGGAHVSVADVTIDDILTAQAAGQARITAVTTIIDDQVQPDKLQPTSFSQRRSSRFREPQHNDPQAMKSIGRR